MKEECLICKAPLQYLEGSVEMECAVCHKKQSSHTQCIHGHYVCDACHTAGIDTIFGLCLSQTSKDPVAIYDQLVALPFCHMHGPEHHVIVGASLLTAFRNAGGKLELSSSLSELHNRATQVPGGACGFWGACGAAISTGMFVSVATGSTPLSGPEWGLANRMTSRSLETLGKVGGPRCCKRNSYLAIQQAVAFAAEHLGVQMELSTIRCSHFHRNNQCITSRCPFHPI